MLRHRHLVLIPAAKLGLHLAFYRGYGFFRDELYYLACSERLAFGYVDHPPLSILLLAIERALLGDSLFAVRVLPAVAGALTVLLAGLLARALGGGRFAQVLAMVAVGIEYLGVFHVVSMNSLDVLIWTAVGLLLVRLLRGAPARTWLLLGALLGLGLQNKIGVLWLGAGLAAALVLTPERRWLRTPGPWLAAGLAALLFLPHLAWQVAHGWPTLEFIANATGEKMIEVAPLDFLVGQLTLFSPTVLPVWLAGLLFLAADREGRRYRLLAWIYLAVFAVLLVSGSSRAGYLGPAYTWLLAAGAVAWEGWIAALGRRYLKEALVTVVLAGGLVYLPFSLPVLPVPTYVAYAGALGVGPTTEERKEVAALSQFYADMHGWRELVETVAGVWESLPPDERAAAAIFTYNYGNSGALDHLGRDRGLPPSISGHNNYWLWGPRGAAGEVMIVVGGGDEGLRRRFDSVERAATVDCRWCMPYEDDKPIWIARGPRRPLAATWPELKHYD